MTPFEFYFGYLIYILLLPVFISRHPLNRGLLYVFLILFLTGLLNILLGNNTAALFFKVFTGLCLSYFFYYYVIVEFNYNIERLFKWYLKGAFYAALIGLFQFISFQLSFTPGYNFDWILNKWGVVSGGNFGIRLNSVFAEPTHLGAVLSAAFFVSLYNLFQKESYVLNKLQSILIIVIYILSFSGLGQSGIFVSIILLAVSYGLVRYIFVFVPLFILLFNILYANVNDFRERFDGLVQLFTTGKFELGKTHGSSFILYNNFTVAMKNFEANFIFGSGIGSHPVAFDKYSLAKGFKVYGFNLNSADANSMLLRLISETGLFGVSIFIYLMVTGYVIRNPKHETYHWLVSNGILIMILLNLFRQGHYFLNGFPFFVMLYYFNSVSYKEHLRSLSEEQPKSDEVEEIPS